MELDGAWRIFCTHLTSWRTIAIYCGIAQITVNERFIRLFRPQACTRSFHVVRLTVWKWGQATSKPSEPVPNSSRGLPSKAVEVRELTPGCPWGNEARSPSSGLRPPSPARREKRLRPPVSRWARLWARACRRVRFFRFRPARSPSSGLRPPSPAIGSGGSGHQYHVGRG